MTSLEIPSLDISDFDRTPNTFVEAFRAAYQEWGFAGITGHGIDTSEFDAAFAAAQQFFSLNDEQKRAYQVNHQCGYIPFGVEKAKDAEHVDLKEFYHIARERDDLAYLPTNIWPQEIPGFKPAYQRVYQSLDQLALKLLQVVAISLNLSEDFFSESVLAGETLLRVLHYPPITDPNAPNVRAAAHEDINLITLLAGSEQAGLEVLSRTDEWVPISMIEGTIVCNVGDMLQNLSNGYYPSTTHRVINPTGKAAHTSRYSIPFFVHPSPTTRLDPLAQCISEERPCAYPKVSAAEFLHQRLVDIGLKK